MPHAAATLLVAVLAIYDGDTFTARPISGADDERLRVRVADLDCPERGWRARCETERQAADAARIAAVELLRGARRVELRDIDRDEDPYRRPVATVLIDGRSLADILIAAGHCRRWRGHRSDWCPTTETQP